MDERATTRDRILSAAIARIKHYGYSKTTMAEIASDCEMSPGNIYRFFQSKIDIAEAMARRGVVQQDALISAIAQRKDLPIDQRLRRIFLERVRSVHAQLHHDPKSIEMADVLARERPHYLKEAMATELVILTELIQQGINTGLFSPGDAAAKAETLQIATTRFSSARMLYMNDLPALERRLEMLLDLVLDGLHARPEK
jgi:AcrR family transcriptional regulator